MRVDHGIIRPSDVVAEPWANGRGLTRVLASTDAWRISVAEIDGASEFSAFSGRDRLLVALNESEVALRIGHERRSLRVGEPIEFCGEERVIVESTSRPVTVVNVMTHRAVARASWAIGGDADPTTDAVVVIGGGVLAGGEVLPTGTLVQGLAAQALTTAPGALLRLRWQGAVATGGGDS